MKLARYCLCLAAWIGFAATSFAADDLSEAELLEHDEFVDLISQGDLALAVAKAIKIPSDAPDDEKEYLASKRQYDVVLVEAVLRNLGPAAEPQRLGEQPEDAYYFSWRYDTNDNNSGVVLTEICYSVEYAHYGKGYVFTRSLNSELVGFGFALGMSDTRAHSRWADIQDALTEIQRDRPHPVPPRSMKNP